MRDAVTPQGMRVIPAEPTFPAVNADVEVARIAQRYVQRVGSMRPDVSAVRVQAAFLHACLDWLNRTGKDAAEELREQADILQRAARLLAGAAASKLTGDWVLGKLGIADNDALNQHFLSMVYDGDASVHARRAVEALAQMAIDLHRDAHELVRGDAHSGFYNLLGRAFGRAGLPLPEPSEALAVCEVLRRHLPQAAADRLAQYDVHDTDKARAAMARGYRAR